MNALLQNLSSNYVGKIKFVGFPCNQFAHQEPAANKTELMNGLKYVRPGSMYEPAQDFNLVNKTEVNGVNESSVYTYLKETCRLPTAAKFDPRESFWDPIRPHDVAWNFEKFLMDRHGRPLFRFLSSVEPFDIYDILKELVDNTGKMDKKALLENQVIASSLSKIEDKYKSEY